MRLIRPPIRPGVDADEIPYAWLTNQHSDPPGLKGGAGTAVGVRYGPVFLAAGTYNVARISITAAGAAGATARPGLYEPRPSKFGPGALIVDAGFVAADAVADVSAVVSFTLARSGIYWNAVQFDSPGAFPSIQSSRSRLLNFDGAAINNITYTTYRLYVGTTTAGALAADASAAGLSNNGQPCRILWGRQ